MDNPIVWFEIYVQDMPRARKFYEAVFQIKLEKLPVDDPEMWQFPGNPERWGASGTLVKAQGVASGASGTLVYFACEDCAVEEARVPPAGGRIKRGKMSIGQYGFVSLVLDPDGNMIGLHSMK